MWIRLTDSISHDDNDYTKYASHQKTVCRIINIASFVSLANLPTPPLG